MEHWGKQSDPGLLSNLRCLINRTLVDKSAKTFSTHLNVSSPSEPIDHESSLEWLSSLAKSVVENHVMPKEINDPIHALHHSFLYVGFLYTDLRKAIRYEEGAHIIRLWRH